MTSARRHRHRFGEEHDGVARLWAETLEGREPARGVLARLQPRIGADAGQQKGGIGTGGAGPLEIVGVGDTVARLVRALGWQADAAEPAEVDLSAKAEAYALGTETFREIHCLFEKMLAC